MSYKIDWGSLITEIVIKKDLDCNEFKDCWEEDYDWRELDLFVIYNWRDLLISYGEVEKERLNIRVNLEKDLNKYIKEVLKE